MQWSSPVTQPAILNGVCCPPQEPFKLSAKEPPMKAQKKKGDEVKRRPQECREASEWTVSVEVCGGFMSLESDLKQREKTTTPHFSFLTTIIKYNGCLSHKILNGGIVIYIYKAAPIDMF